MNRLFISTVSLLAILLTACSNLNSNLENSDGDTINIHAGTYKGIAYFDSRDSPLTIDIYNNGKIKIVDEDNIVVYGKLEGDSFKIRRNWPFEMFEGTISDGVINGITYGNPFLGDSTFSATLVE